MTKKQEGTNSFSMQIELKGLIRVLAKNLYAESDVFIRELIQNAQDSIVKRQQESNYAGGIWIKTDFPSGTIVVRDNGAGMTEDEIHKYLSRIGASGTRELKEQLMARNISAAERLIGQFGIGLLSAFIVAKRIVIQTKSHISGTQAYRWESQGDEVYSLQACDYPEIGTEVTLYIDDDHKDVLNSDKIRKAIKKYADFIGTPILLNDEESPANIIDAPWHKTYQTEGEKLQDYNVFIQLRYPDYPLEIIPIHVEKPYKVDGVLYVTDRRAPAIDITGTVDVYVSRMFITSDNRDLLPLWAKFVRGVIDSPSLTPTTSRDAVQQDTVFTQIRESIGNVIIDHIRKLALEHPDRFQPIMQWHNYHIKGMAIQREDFFSAISDLIPFDTNRGLMNLETYIKQLDVPGSTSKNIYYVTESGIATQFYILCNAKGLLVIDASHTFEDAFLKKYAAVKNINLHPIDFEDSELIFEQVPDELSESMKRLERQYTYLFPDLGCIARSSSFKPDSLPAVITVSKDQKLRRELEQEKGNLKLPNSVRDLLNRIAEERTKEPLVLHLNANNRIVQRLAAIESSPTATIALVTLYNNALLLAQHYITPPEAERMFQNFTQVLEALIQHTTELEEARRRTVALEIALKEQVHDQASALTEHISCFVAMPFRDYDFLFSSLKEIFETKPYFWEVIRADKEYLEEGLLDNIYRQMAKAHFFIVEISDQNPNVMLELGMLQAFEKPTILLVDDKAASKINSDLKGKIYLRYSRPSINDNDFIEGLRDEFAKVTDLQSLKSEKHYLSPLVLRHDDVSTNVAEKISRRYTTIEDFLSAKPYAISMETGVSEMVVQILRDHIMKLEFIEKKRKII